MTPENIKKIRHDAGLTVTEMAIVLNLSEPETNGADAVRKFERGAKDPSGPVIRILQLLEAGRIPLDVVLG